MPENSIPEANNLQDSISENNKPEDISPPSNNLADIQNNTLNNPSLTVLNDLRGIKKCIYSVYKKINDPKGKDSLSAIHEKLESISKDTLSSILYQLDSVAKTINDNKTNHTLSSILQQLDSVSNKVNDPRILLAVRQQLDNVSKTINDPKIKDTLSFIQQQLKSISNENEEETRNVKKNIKKTFSVIRWATLGLITLIALVTVFTSFFVYQNYAIKYRIESFIGDTSGKMSKNFEELVKVGDFKSAFFMFSKKTTDLLDELKLTKEALNATQSLLSVRISKIEKDSGDASKEFKVRSEQMVKSFDNLKTGFDQFGMITQKNLNESLDSIRDGFSKRSDEIRADSSKRLDEIKKELGGQLGSQISSLDKSLSNGMVSLDKRVKASENGLFNVEKIFKVPDSTKMDPVQLLLDDGSAMADYRFQDAVNAILSVMGDSIRRSPKRKIGLTLGHDGQLAVKAKTDILYEDGYQNLRNDSTNFRVDRNSPTNHLDLLESAVSQLSATKSDGQKILILITGGTNKIPLINSDIAKSCEQAKIAVFVLQLSFGAGDSPSPVLSAISIESGGHFTTIFFPANLEGPKLDQNKTLLKRALFSCLGLSESVER